MGKIPTPEEAYELVKQYNKEPFHLEHARTVSKVMGVLAREYDPERVDFWRTVGMLHDIDFELWPEQHCVKANELLREMDMDEGLIHAVVSHGWGICSDVEPELYMEKVLFAVDELTGLIGAAALMRPTGLEGMEAKSVSKKFKDKKFAAGCSRDVIRQGAEKMDVELNELFAMTLRAMQEPD
ncbi:MAG: hydrolase [Oscillospiraceae bacterium]|nr:hydrolase [Oscillospiraceae bacterium]